MHLIWFQAPISQVVAWNGPRVIPGAEPGINLNIIRCDPQMKQNLKVNFHRWHSHSIVQTPNFQFPDFLSPYALGVALGNHGFSKWSHEQNFCVFHRSRIPHPMPISGPSFLSYLLRLQGGGTSFCTRSKGLLLPRCLTLTHGQVTAKVVELMSHGLKITRA